MKKDVTWRDDRAIWIKNTAETHAKSKVAHVYLMTAYLTIDVVVDYLIRTTDYDKASDVAYDHDAGSPVFRVTGWMLAPDDPLCSYASQELDAVVHVVFGKEGAVSVVNH
jgi:hypothetical protein